MLEARAKALAVALLLVLGLAGGANAALVGYWAFDGDLTDSANGYHGSWYDNAAPGAASYGAGRDGTPSGAVSVDGSNEDYAEMDLSAAGVGLDQMTIAGWVNTSNTVPDWAAWWGADSVQLRAEVRGDNGTPQNWTDGAGGEGRIQGPGPDIRDNSWHHLAVTLSETANTAKLYLDGAEHGRSAWSQTDGVNTFQVGNSFAWQTQSTQSRIDDVGLWSDVLGPHEVGLLATGTAPNALPPVYDFEDGSLPVGWTETGTAFDNQPTNSTRHVFNKSGDWFLGTFEDGNGDSPTGTLTGTDFTVTGNAIRALIGAGAHDGAGSETQLQLQLEVSPGVWQTVRRDSGHALPGVTGGPAGEPMREYRWNVSDLMGETARVRVVDNNGGGWGHLNTDKIRLVDETRRMRFYTDFDGTTLDPTVIPYRPYHVPGAQLTGTGQFEFDLTGDTDYNAWAGVNHMPQLRLDIDDSWSGFWLETHLTSRTGTVANTHTGLMLVFEDRATGEFDVVGFGPYAGNGLRAEGPFFFDTNADNDGQLNALAGQDIRDVFLQIEKLGPWYSFYYRFAESNPWTLVGTKLDPGNKTLLYAGLFDKSFGVGRAVTSQYDFLRLTAVPEPGTLGLLGLGALALWRRRWS